jgi:hypothetical protein
MNEFGLVTKFHGSGEYNEQCGVCTQWFDNPHLHLLSCAQSIEFRCSTTNLKLDEERALMRQVKDLKAEKASIGELAA